MLSVWWLQEVEMMYSHQELADTHSLYGLAEVLLWWLAACTKKGVQDEVV
jgi:hypothetical protein